MKNEITVEQWFKASAAILKVNWVQWLFISAITSGVILGIFYFSFKELFPQIMNLIENRENIEASLFNIFKITGLYTLALILFLNFLELFLIHQTSNWYLRINVSIEQSVIKALSAMPIAILLNVVYFILASIAISFCFLPVIFVVIFFLFIFQALVIEQKGFNSLGRSIEIVKSNFGIFTVILFIISFGFYMINSVPFFILQTIFTESITPEILGKINPEEIYELIMKSPYTFYFIFGIIFVISLQMNLKTILYTVAFEEGRKDRKIENTSLEQADKFN